MNFLSNLTFFPNEFTEVVNFENCYLGIYPEFFLIIVLSCLIGFLVVIDYKFKYKVVLTTVAGKILLVTYLLLLIITYYQWESERGRKECAWERRDEKRNK